MSMNWLKENIAKARANLTAEVSKFKNKDFMEAVVSGCALVAAADGSVDASEKQKMAGFLERSDELKHFDIRQVIEVFNKSVGDFEFDQAIGKANALKAIGKVRGKDDQARVLVRVVCAIGAADGDFDEDEKAVVREIAQELGLNPAEFDL
ncbi:tellurite resistance TerB family protein [Nitrincola iocasae]|jgi:tellurite resistance protein TerB|uniref:Tellurite resistance TerB n=1 Tax=Nitrincola iocasae TaxID=2614693 RepID=A0A5J6LD15_9GAMM|nr:tellurite resistance TerB family protein [Nitrincola iocasae]QEW06410.1 Tellurite resistance TerB [Nitrincola iocasae]